MLRTLISALVFYAIAILIVIQQDPLGDLLMHHYVMLNVCFTACVVMGAWNFYDWLMGALE